MTDFQGKSKSILVRVIGSPLYFVIQRLKPNAKIAWKKVTLGLIITHCNLFFSFTRLLILILDSFGLELRAAKCSLLSFFNVFRLKMIKWTDPEGFWIKFLICILTFQSCSLEVNWNTPTDIKLANSSHVRSFELLPRKRKCWTYR